MGRGWGAEAYGIAGVCQPDLLGSGGAVIQSPRTRSLRFKTCPPTPPSAPPMYIFLLRTHPLQTPPIRVMHQSQVVETRWLAHPSQAAETLAHASESSNWDAQTGRGLIQVWHDAYQSESIPQKKKPQDASCPPFLNASFHFIKKI